MEKVFIALAPYAWGKGETIEEAWKQVRKSWHHLYAGNYSKHKTAVFECHPETWVNEMGGLVHPVGHKPVEVFRGNKL